MFTALLLAAQGRRATGPAVTIYVHCAAVSGTGLQSHGACSHNLYSLCCSWRHRAAEPRGLQSQSMFTVLLMVAQGCRATEPAVTVYVHFAADGGSGLQSYGACGHNLCSLCCCWRHRAAEPPSLQSQSIFTALLLTAQGCRATGPAVTICIHCAVDGGTGLQSYRACGHNLCSLRCCWRHRAAEPRGLRSQSMFTALLLAAQGCRATEPAVTIYIHFAAHGGTELQSHGACSHNLCSLCS